MSKIEEDLEQKKIDEITEQYAKLGYSVIKEPGSNVLPKSLKGLIPDIYAVKNAENIIIEVVSKNNFNKLSISDVLAKKVKDIPGWRFDLVMVNPRENEIINQNQQLLSLKETEVRLREIQKLIDLGQYTASILLIRSVLEAIIRNIAKNHNIQENISFLSLIKSLMSQDILNELDYQVLTKAWKNMNLLTHGYKCEMSHQDINELLKLMSSLMLPRELPSPTIIYEGSGTYYIGEKIKFIGTSIRNEYVYCFVTGKSLASFGARLDNIKISVKDDDPDSFTKVRVNSDGIWEYTWNTAEAAPDLREGRYTIYVAVHPFSLKSLDKTIHEQASIIIKRPFIVASMNSNTIAKGDDLIFQGTATGYPDYIFIWIFGGSNKFSTYKVPVNKDGTYQLKIEGEFTKNFISGQYYVVVQHPMMNAKPDVIAKGKNIVVLWSESIVINVDKMQTFEAVAKLIDLLNSPECDDTYTTLSFLIEEPWLRIDTIGYKKIGDTFTITGTTNIAEGNHIYCEISHKPKKEGFPLLADVSSGIITIQRGETYNQWSFDVDSSTFEPGEYMFVVGAKNIRAESHEFFSIEK